MLSVDNQDWSKRERVRRIQRGSYTYMDVYLDALVSIGRLIEQTRKTLRGFQRNGI